MREQKSKPALWYGMPNGAFILAVYLAGFCFNRFKRAGIGAGAVHVAGGGAIRYSDPGGFLARLAAIQLSIGQNLPNENGIPVARVIVTKPRIG